jgi:hypothetical protein
VIGALVLVLVLVAAGCGDSCGKINQVFILDSPDSDLQALVDACAKGPSCAPTCELPDACLPLCQRVLDITNQFPGTASIERCFLRSPGSFSAPDAGLATAGAVDVTYRPSSCP